MAVYSGNRTRLGAYSDTEVVANENYGHQTGLLQMMVENVQNDQAIFEAVIYNDFREAAGVVEESTILNEAGNFVDKIKQFLMNCWEKIKGFFKSFFVKFNNVIIRDNKEFVQKYQREVIEKDLSKMKYKWSKYTPDAVRNPIDNITANAVDKLKEMRQIDKDNVIEDIRGTIEDGSLLNGLLSKAVTNTTKADFAKDYHAKVFGEKEEVQGIDNSLLRSIMKTLTDSTDVLKGLKECQTSTDKSFKELLSKIDEFGKEQAKLYLDKSKTTSENAVSQGKRANLAYKIVQVQQEALNMIIKAQTDAAKFQIAQCRRVYAQCATFDPKSVRESAILVEAAGDAAEYDTMSSFEDYSL